LRYQRRLGKEIRLARNQYSFEKRRREIAKKKKKEEKRQKKLEKKNPPAAADGEAMPASESSGESPLGENAGMPPV
jgi:septal ring factor EnvC (AmiA/AmiB activator)